MTGEMLKSLCRRALHSGAARNSGTVLVITLYTTLMGFAGQFLVARGLSPVEFGYYSIATGLVGVATIFCLAGSDTTMMQFTARYGALDDAGASRRLFRTLLAAGLATSAVVALAILLAGSRAFAAPFGVFAFAAAVLIPICLSLLFQARLRGLHRILPGFLPEGVVRPTVFVALAGAALAAGALTSAERVLALFLAGALAGAGLGALFLRRTAVPGGGTTAPSEGARHWLRNSFTFFGISLANALNTQVGVLILGWLALPVEAGIFGVVIRLSTLVVFLLTVINAVFSPSIVSLHTSGQFSSLHRLLRAAVGFSFAFALPAAGVLLAAPEFILGLFGPSFIAGAAALRIAALGFLVNAALGPYQTTLALCGHQVVVARIQYLGTAVNIALTYALAQRLGAAGAAWGAAASLLVMYPGCFLLARRLGFLSVQDSPQERRNPSSSDV